MLVAGYMLLCDLAGFTGGCDNGFAYDNWGDLMSVAERKYRMADAVQAVKDANGLSLSRQDAYVFASRVYAALSSFNATAPKEETPELPPWFAVEVQGGNGSWLPVERELEKARAEGARIEREKWEKAVISEDT